MYFEIYFIKKGREIYRITDVSLHLIRDINMDYSKKFNNIQKSV